MPPKVLSTLLWIAQLLLAAQFFMAGGMKLFTPWDEMVRMVAEAKGLLLSEALTRFIGAAEIAGALGMILPAATRVWPILTAWAAVGLGTIMVLACSLHIYRAEWGMVGLTAFLLVLSAFVAWGRFKARPITPRVGQ